MCGIQTVSQIFERSCSVTMVQIMLLVFGPVPVTVAWSHFKETSKYFGICVLTEQKNAEEVRHVVVLMVTLDFSCYTEHLSRAPNI